MSKASPTSITPAPVTAPPLPSRRRLLAGSGLAAGLAALALPAAAAPMFITGHPDAELIRLCAEHVANLEAYNRDGGTLPMDQPDPLWDAYARTRDAIDGIKPRTRAGMMAKARAARAEAAHDDDALAAMPGERWAWDLLNDLLAGSAEA